MSYLLDTCVVSEATRPRPAPTVIDWLRSLDPEALHLSVLTLGEIERGIGRLPSGGKKQRLRIWFETLVVEADTRIVPIDKPIALEWGRLLANAEQRGQPLPVIDALLAATAIVRGFSVVTRNSSDIARTGVPIVDPWQTA